jgi:hypothetical protein
MADSSKYQLKIRVGRTRADRDKIESSLRSIALTAVGVSRYGGNLSLLLESIANLPEDDRLALATILKNFLK